MSSGQGDYRIRLDVIGNNVSELLQTQRGMAKVREEANGLAQALKAGFGIDIAGRINSGLAQLPRILGNAVDRGYEFNKRMFDAEIGISNVLAKFLKLDAAAARREAAKAMEQIIELEPKTAGTLDNLVEGFLATVAASQAAGISVEENIDLVGRFANAVANANLPTNQLAQEMRAILTGNITADAALAKVLGITNPDVTKFKQSGDLYGFLTEKIGQLGQAGDSAAVRISTLQSAIDKTLGKITEPIFERVFGGTKELTDAVNDPELVESLNSIGLQIADLVDAGIDLTKWAIENSDALVLVAQAAATLGVAFAAIKIKDLLISLGGSARAWLVSRLAVEAETMAIRRNSEALAANAIARGTATRLNRDWNVGAGFTSGALIALTAGAMIIKAIESSTLARLEAEERISQLIVDRDKARNDEIRNLRSLEAAAKKRLELETELKRIDEQVASRRDELAPVDPVAGSSQFQVRTLTQGGRNLENDREINRLMQEREEIVRDIALLNNPNRIGDIISSNVENDKSTALIERQEKAYKAATDRAEELEEKVKGLRREMALLATDSKGQLGILRGEVGALNLELEKQLAQAEELPDAEKRAAVMKDLQLQAEAKRIPLLASIQELVRNIAEEEEKATEKAESDAKAAREKARALQDGLNALKLAEIDTKLAQIEADPFATTSEKRARRQPILGEKQGQLSAERGSLESQLGQGVADDEARLAIQTRLNEVLREQVLIQGELAMGSFWGEFGAEFTAYVDSLGTDAQRLSQLFSTVGDSIRTSLGSAFAQAIISGGTFQERALGFANAVGMAFINNAAQMVADWIYSHLIMENVRRIFNVKRLAEETATQGALTTLEVSGETARTGVKAGAAATNVAIASGEAAAVGTATGIAGVFRSIMELGPIAGPVVFGASVLGMISLVRGLTKGFATGGIFHGEGTGTSDSNLIRISNGEGIVQKAAVDYYGEDFFNAFNNMELGAAPLATAAGVAQPSIPDGALSGGKTVASPNVTVLVIPGEREATRIARHSEARGDIVRIVREELSTILAN